MELELKKTQRVRQVFRWLVAHYPTPFPVELEFFRPHPKNAGDSVLHNRRIYIRLNSKPAIRDMNEVLLHEYAHAMTYRNERVDKHHPDHSPEWGLAYAQLYRDFNEFEGWKESKAY